VLALEKQVATLCYHSFAIDCASFAVDGARPNAYYHYQGFSGQSINKVYYAFI
jgi:hypothetical protein